MAYKLLLINPTMTAKGQRLPHAGGIATMEPLGLAYVAALTPPHWDVRIVDETMEDLSSTHDPDLVGLSSLTITVPRAYEIARQFRQQGVPVVMGGVHATLLPEEAEQHVDVVFQGEAERSWPSVIRDFEAGSLKRRYNGGAPELKGLRLPRRSEYRHRYSLRLISASRGCRYRCEFCTLWKLDGGDYRARPPEDVVCELETLGRGRPILFTDENVFTDRNWAMALLKRMEERGIHQPYAVQASLDIADDEEVLAALRRTGCMTVLIGFESVSEASLRAMRKGVNLKIGVERYGEKVARLHDHGLASAGTFMFGYDGDDMGIFERTVDFVLESGVDVAHFGLLTPNPGTDLYDRLAREGRLLYTNFPADYARYDLRTAVFRPRQMTPVQLEEGLVRAVQAVGTWRAVSCRAWNTWRATGNVLMAAIAFGWNRSGLYRRVVE